MLISHSVSLSGRWRENRAAAHAHGDPLRPRAVRLTAARRAGAHQPKANGNARDTPATSAAVAKLAWWKHVAAPPSRGYTATTCAMS